MMSFAKDATSRRQGREQANGGPARLGTVRAVGLALCGRAGPEPAAPAVCRPDGHDWRAAGAVGASAIWLVRGSHRRAPTQAPDRLGALAPRVSHPRWGLS